MWVDAWTFGLWGAEGSSVDLNFVPHDNKNLDYLYPVSGVVFPSHSTLAMHMKVFQNQ